MGRYVRDWEEREKKVNEKKKVRIMPSSRKQHEVRRKGKQINVSHHRREREGEKRRERDA